MSDGTPHFRKPPVIETVISVQFEPLEGLKSAHYGLLWDQFREQFPAIEDHEPLPPFEERAGRELKHSLEQALRWTLEPMRPLPRVLFRKSKDGQSRGGDESVQLQRDRVVYNWARSSLEEQDYPTFRYSKERFLGIYEQLRNFVVGQAIGELRPNLGEVTYINRIPVSGGSLEEVVGRTFPGVSLKRSDNFLPNVESVFVNQAFPIPASRGHLYVHFKGPVVLKSNLEVVDFRVTALVAPAKSESESIAELLEFAHVWAVNGFKSITSSEMHTEWELQL